MIDTMPSNMRSFRVDDELWEGAQRIAKARGDSLSSDVLRPALERYVERYSTEESLRPWMVWFTWDGMPSHGAGSYAVLVENPDGSMPAELVDPREQNGGIMKGTWYYDGRDERARMAMYHRLDQN